MAGAPDVPRVLVLSPPAKINLCLRVGAVRGDGFHEVRTILQSVSLSDTIRVTRRRGPFVIACRTPGVPSGRDNLVWRAADALWRACGRDGEPRDVRVQIDKRIPAAAGLGGGSADAAAALVALNRVWGAGRSLRDLLALAAGVGSDVPFFLHGGTALGVDRGDEVYPLADIARAGVVILKPAFGIRTADAYRWLDEDRARSAAAAGAQRLEVGWSHGTVEVGNDLQAPAARRHPEIQEMVAACLREGASAAAMTGSGSAVFGVFPDGAGPRAARRLRRPDWLVLVARTLSRQEAVRRMGL